MLISVTEIKKQDFFVDVIENDEVRVSPKKTILMFNFRNSGTEAGQHHTFGVYLCFRYQ